MKIKNDRIINNRKAKNKETFVFSILEKISSIIKREPKTFLKDKFKKLSDIENRLNIKNEKLDSIVEKSRVMKSKVQEEIDKLNKSNLSIRTRLTKQLGTYEKGKTQK